MILLVGTLSLHGMQKMTGDRITTRAGSISFSELMSINNQFWILRNAYIITTSCIVGYLIYEKIKEYREKKEHSSITHA